MENDNTKALAVWTDPELIDLNKSMDSVESAPGPNTDLLLGSDS